MLMTAFATLLTVTVSVPSPVGCSSSMEDHWNSNRQVSPDAATFVVHPEVFFAVIFASFWDPPPEPPPPENGPRGPTTILPSVSVMYRYPSSTYAEVIIAACRASTCALTASPAEAWTTPSASTRMSTSSASAAVLRDSLGSLVNSLILLVLAAMESLRVSSAAALALASVAMALVFVLTSVISCWYPAGVDLIALSA